MINSLRVPSIVQSRHRPKQGSLSLGGFTVLLFLTAQFVGMTRRLIMSVHGDDFNQVAAAITYGSVALLPFAILFYRNQASRNEGLEASARHWSKLIMFLSAVAFIFGLSRGYDLRQAIQDYAPYLVILAFAHLGAQPKFWQDFYKVLPYIVVAAVMVNSFGFRNYSEGFTIDAQQRVARETLAYTTQSTLDLWPVLLFLSFGRGLLPTSIAAGAAAFALLQQVLFQKRLGSVLVMVYIFIGLVILPRIGRSAWRSWRSSQARAIRVVFTTVSLVAIATALALRPQVVLDQFQGLIDRFQGRGLHQQASGSGLLNTLTVDNERFDVARELFADFEPLEYLIGRGMGGHFEIDVQLSESDTHLQEQIAASFLGDVGVFGRRSLEIGILMPFLKGGSILAAAYIWGQYLVLRRRKVCFADQTSTACWLLLLLENLQLLQGGGFIMSAVFKLVIIGACFGRCLSKSTQVAAQ